MPLYEYQCVKCKHVYEDFVQVKISSDGVDNTAHPKCPKCDSIGLKQMSLSTFKINGYSEANGYSKKA